jgi:FkbM family methyltransferase
VRSLELYESPAGTRIHVSADEEAGANVLARGGPKSRERALWAILARELDYQSVFDLGANYGQVTLEQVYGDSTRIVLVEANPGLIPYLERTVEAHPNRGHIELVNAALGQDDGTAQLFVRHDAVGKSSLIRHRGDAVTVPQRSLDSLLRDAPVRGNAILKLDVEGSELAALEGAQSTLGSLENYAIMVELHPGFMRETAGSVGHYLELLCGYGALYELASSKRHLRTFNFSKFVRHGRLTDVVIVAGAEYGTHLRELRQSPTSANVSSGPQTSSAPNGLRARIKRRLRAIGQGGAIGG